MIDTMPDMLTDWGWMVFALILAGLEIVMPGVFLIWLAMAAALTGLLTFTFGLGWETQLMVFAVLAVAAIVTGRAILKRHPIHSDDNLLNQRGARLVGETVIVSDAIRNGQGRVQIADSQWTARGADADTGTQVRIVRVDGAVVHVEPA